MGSLMEARRRILLSSPHKETIQNADIAQFSTDMRSPLRALTLSIDPVQDLHGYDSPWPSGGGKNKFNVFKLTPSANISISANGTITVTGNAINGGERLKNCADVVDGETYVLSATTTSVENYVYLYGTNTSWYFGTQRTLTQSDLDSYVFFYGGRGTTSQISDMMIRLSSVSDASFAPYSNLCPISGWDGANVWRTGKNLLDPEKRTQTSNNIRYYVADGFLLKSGQTYTLSVSGSPASGLYFVRMSDNSNIALKYSDTKLTYTPTEDVLVKCNIYYSHAPSGGLDDIKCQLELSSTPTPYTPYTGTTIPVTWEAAGTVYGGVWDVLSGVLRVDRAKYTIDSTTPIAQIADNRDGNLRIKYASGIPAYKVRASGICSAFPVITTETAYNYAPSNCVFYSNGVFVMPPAGVEHTEQAYLQWLTSVGAIEVVMELATPITIPLTPQEISTLAGQNVVWWDAGKIELLKYWTHK